jgi:3-oxoacyl-[acyl-carrier-protein] synthase III
LRGAAVVVGVGESRYYKRGGAPESEFQLACIAIRNAVEDAGLSMKDVDGFVSYMERNEPVRLSAALGTGDLRWTAQTFGGGGNGAGAAVTLADAAITAKTTTQPSKAPRRHPKLTRFMIRPLCFAAERAV